MAKGINIQKNERLMKTIYDAQEDLYDLAVRESLTLTKLSKWANDVNTIEALDGLCRLNDARAQLLVSRYRTLAAAKLFELAKDEDGGEISRKACVDLLKVSLVPLITDRAGYYNPMLANNNADPETIRNNQAIVDANALRQLLAQVGRLSTDNIPPESRENKLPEQNPT